MVRCCSDGRLSPLVLLLAPLTMAAAVVVAGVLPDVDGRCGRAEDLLTSPPALELGRRTSLGTTLMYAELGVEVSVGSGLGSRRVDVCGDVASGALLLMRLNKRCVF